jgi:hypothetical protein
MLWWLGLVLVFYILPEPTGSETQCLLQVLKPTPQVASPPPAATPPEAVAKEVETKASGPPATNTIATAFAAQVSCGATNAIY